jgi:predicted ferric reductase
VNVLTDERLLWFLNRGSGVVVLVLLTASTALGVLSTMRLSSTRWPRFVTQALHRNIALLVLVLMIVHAGTAIADEYVDLSMIDAFVPFASTDRVFWGSLGTLSLDLVLLAVVTSVSRHRFGLRRWRAVHLSTYAAWPLGLAHGLGMGSDQRSGWSIVLTVACVAVVAASVYLRVTTRAGGTAGPKPSRSGGVRAQ